MRKILMFFLILVSFSCTTLDSNLKESQSVEKNDKIDEVKTGAVASNQATEAKDLNNSKEIVSPREETTNSTIPSAKEEEKTPTNSSSKVEKKEEKKEENRKEEKKDEKSKQTKEEKPSKEAPSKNDEVQAQANKNKEAKPKEVIDNPIVDEKALQDYDGLFPASTKIEPKKEEKKKEKDSILASIEVLKELEDAINFFQKTPPNIVKQRVEKQEKVTKVETSPKEMTPPIEKPNVKPPTPAIAKKDEGEPSKQSPITEPDEQIFNDDDMLSFDDSEESTFDFDDEQMPFTFNDEESKFTFNEEPAPFNFDDNKKDEIAKNNESTKKEIPDNKGQLSSIVDEEDKVNISRYTNILKGQNIDFSYPGEGWVYLGEETSQKGLSYVKRKMEDGKTIFKFMAENEGNYVLNFSYFDVFSGDFIVDAVSVKVMPNNDGIQKDSLVLEYQGKGGKKTPEAQAKKTPNEVNVDADKVGIKTEDATKKDTNSTKQSSKNVISESNMEKLTPAVPSKTKEDATYKEPEVFTNIASISPENAKTKVAGEDAKKIIDEVSKEISNGNAKKALERLEDFFAIASTNMDEAYFLRGKAYELNTDQKNIKLALAAYKFLTKTFPDSPLWNEADARIRYIEKFFVKIK